MKLILRRDQRPALIGSKPVFQLDVRAEISEEEKALIKKYKFGDTLLYERKPLKESSNEYAQLGNLIAWRTLNLTITVDNLASGKRIECKDILEMLAAQEAIKEAAETFAAILQEAEWFGGEEVVEL